MSSRDSDSSSNDGFNKYWPSSEKPTRAAPSGPPNGIPEIASAADAPSIAAISESCVLEADITVKTT